MSEPSNQGQSARHTPADLAGDPAGSGAEAATNGRDLADLIAGSPDIEAQDLLAVAAELAAAPRRGRGRPAGSPNRKNKEMIDYLAALGHRDPWVTLSMIQSADTMQLARALATALTYKGKIMRDEDGNPILEIAPVQVLGIQKAAAEALMKYHHAAQPQQLDLPMDGEGYKRPFMAIGELHGNIVVAPDGRTAMSIHDEPANSQGNQRVIEADGVRHDGDQSHNAAKPLETNDNPTTNG